MNQKLNTLDSFVNKIKNRQISKNIVKIIHYGSTATKNYSRDSDIDVLLVSTGDIKKVDEECSKISYDILLTTGEKIEPFVYCIDDFLYPSYFIYNVKKNGRVVFSMNEKEIKKNESFDLLTLAKKFNKMAKDIYNIENLRGVIDLAYNSAELCAKAFIMLEGKDAPKTHNGIVTIFSELFVKTSKVSLEIGRILNRGLDRRNKARYDAHTTILEEDAKSILELSDKLVAMLEEKIKDGKF